VKGFGAIGSESAPETTSRVCRPFQCLRNGQMSAMEHNRWTGNCGKPPKSVHLSRNAGPKARVKGERFWGERDQESNTQAASAVPSWQRKIAKRAL
jgi:hypothetical protein